MKICLTSKVKTKKHVFSLFCKLFSAISVYFQCTKNFLPEKCFSYCFPQNFSLVLIIPCRCPKNYNFFKIFKTLKGNCFSASPTSKAMGEDEIMCATF